MVAPFTKPRIIKVAPPPARKKRAPNGTVKPAAKKGKAPAVVLNGKAISQEKNKVYAAKAEEKKKQTRAERAAQRKIERDNAGLPSFLQDPQIGIEETPEEPTYADADSKTNIFNRDVFDEICQRIEDGETVTGVLSSDKNRYPRPGMFFRWADMETLVENGFPRPKDDRFEGVAKQYAHSMEMRKRVFEERYNDVISKPLKGVKKTITRSEKDGYSEKVEIYDATARTHIHAEGLKWWLSKTDPKKYGVKSPDEGNRDPNDIHIHGGLPPENVPVEDDELDDDSDDGINQDSDAVNTPIEGLS